MNNPQFGTSELRLHTELNAHFALESEQSNSQNCDSTLSAHFAVPSSVTDVAIPNFDNSELRLHTELSAHFALENEQSNIREFRVETPHSVPTLQSDLS